MKKQFFYGLVYLLTCISYSASAQKSDPSFGKFESQEDSLMRNAYDKRDDKAYEKELKSFLTRYSKLPKDEKEESGDMLMNSYYNLACLYSLKNNKPAALNNFEAAIKVGYVDYAHANSDKDLDNIREEPRFKTLQQQIRNVGDYGYILKKGAQYNADDKREFPKFTYQAADDPNLVALRKRFNLDSIAGTGNDVSRIISLLHWIHNLVPHDGSHENPVVRNAMNMIAVCKKEKRGLNCRGLATVLNECYLALGIPSRFVTCLPKDSLKRDPDCHVINMVYCKSMNKWIWIDPTNDAYVMNEKGELMSIEEVRERLIEDKPLILNPDANWNHKSSVVKEEYLYQYMSKNLYMIECALNSEYDLESFEKGKTLSYVRLLPMEYYEQKPDKKEMLNSKSGTTFVYYKTNNPALFWQKP
jgi:hypothetical protein